MAKIRKKYTSLPVQVRASFWFLICAFLQKGISVITTPIFTRILTTSEYGDYSVWNSWLGIATVFVSLNLYFGVFTSGLVRYEEDRTTFVTSLESLNFLSCVVWLVVYLFTKTFWNHLFSVNTSQMLCMLLMIWTTSIYNFWSSEQRVNFKYRALVAVTLIMAVAKPALGIILVLNSQDKVTARILGLCVVELVLFVPLFIHQRVKARQLINTKYWKYALLFNIPLIPHYLSQVILNSSDRIMIKNMVGSSEAGIYNLAYSIALIMTVFNTALMQTIEPWMYIKLKQNKAKDITKVAYGSFALVAIINILLIVLAPEIVAIFAPSSYQNAIWLIPPISMSVYFLYQYTFFAVVEFYYKKTQFISVATMIGAIVNLITNYIFIKMFGYQAAAYTTLGCYILYVVFHYIFSRKLCRQNLGYEIYNTKMIVLSSAGFLVAGFVSMVLYLNTVIRYVVLAAIVILIIANRKKLTYIARNMLAVRKESKNG